MTSGTATGVALSSTRLVLEGGGGGASTVSGICSSLFSTSTGFRSVRALSGGTPRRWYRCWHLVRGRELLVRWAEMNVFSGAVFRSHEGLLPAAFHQPWSDTTTLQHFARMAKLFVALRTRRG